MASTWPAMIQPGNTQTLLLLPLFADVNRPTLHLRSTETPVLQHFQTRSGGLQSTALQVLRTLPMIALLLFANPGHSQSSAHAARRVLWLTPAPVGLIERLRGQLSDLDVEIIATPLAAPRSPHYVRQQARLANAIAAMWADRLETGHYRLHVYGMAQDDWTQRDFGTDDSPNGESAAVEALAIGARSAVRRLMQSEQNPQAADEPQPPTTSKRRRTQSAPVAMPARQSDPARGEERNPLEPSPVATLSSPRRAKSEITAATEPNGPTAAVGLLQMRMRIGWSAIDMGSVFFHGPDFELGANMDIWSVYLGFSASLSRRISVGETDLSLRVDRTLGALRVLVLDGRHLKLDLALGTGLLRLHRRTVATSSSLIATSSTTSLAALAHGSIGLSVPLWTPRFGTLSASARLGLLGLLTPVTLRVEGSDGHVDSRLQRLQPLGSLGLSAQLP